MPLTFAERELTTDAVLARTEGSFLDRSTAVSERKFGRMLLPLVTDKPPLSSDVNTVDVNLTEAFLNPTLKRAIERDLEDNGGYMRIGVREHVDTHGIRLPDEVASEVRVALVGTGPASIIMGRLLNDIGIRQVRYVSPDSEPGGIWATGGPWGQRKKIGYNNPEPITIQGEMLRLTADRDTMEMQSFLRRVAEREMARKTVLGRLTGVEINGEDHIVHFTDPDMCDGRLHPADYVILGTGSKPLPLNGGHIEFDVPNEDEIVRYPNLMSDEKALLMDSKEQRMICVGWGNSTMAKLREVEDINRRLGTNIQVVVISHFDPNALNYPFDSTRQSDGQLRSVARNPVMGEYTKLELDLIASRERYFRNLPVHTDASGNVVAGTIGDVTKCTLVEENGVTNARITVKNREPFNGKIRGTEEVVIPNVGEVDALIGYGNDPQLMRDSGFTLTDPYRGFVAARPFDGRAITDDNRANVFALGAALANRDNPSARVIPGIGCTAPEIALTIFMGAWEKHFRRKRLGTYGIKPTIIFDKKYFPEKIIFNKELFKK